MIAMLLAILAMQPADPPSADPPADDQSIVVRGRPYGPCGAPFAPVHIAAMGEPFRTNGNADPMKRWFDAADADHDGRLTQREFAADAQRFFASLDTDRDGELDPQEVSAYELDIAPEVRLYRPGAFRQPTRSRDRKQARRDARDRVAYQAPYGAGVYSSLNVPEPVVAADLDIDRAVTAAEFAAVAASRFALLDPAHRGYLVYADLPRSPAQQTIDACLAKERK